MVFGGIDWDQVWTQALIGGAVGGVVGLVVWLGKKLAGPGKEKPDTKAEKRDRDW